MKDLRCHAKTLGLNPGSHGRLISQRFFNLLWFGLVASKKPV